MTNELKLKLETLPLLPGCYLMKDSSGKIIYVGKAKKLKLRVNQYFQGAHDYKTGKLVSQIADFDYIVTNSEKDALLLEINLIKKHRPRYNIMFMDDKTYPYIKLSMDHNYPKIQVVRDKKRSANATYFGPYPDALAARKTIELLDKIYPTRKCKVMPKKVCLYYHMKQCLGPCQYAIKEEVIDNMVEQITRFLKGDTSELQKELTNLMQKSIDELQYEKASEYHQLLNSIQHISLKQHVDYQSKEDVDVFHYYCEHGYIAICGLFVRNGKLLEKTFSLNPIFSDEVEQFVSFIMQYYQKNSMVKTLVLPNYDYTDLQEALLTKIMMPTKGKYKKLLDLCYKNATINLNQNFKAISLNEQKRLDSFMQLQALLNHPVDHIEIFDNSHTQGSFAVAACVVYRNGVESKKEYRHYKVSNQGDDLKNMYEVLYRRYLRVLKEELEKPDLIIVDGGKHQVQVACKVVQAFDLDIKVVGLTKDEHHRTSSLISEDLTEISIDPKSDVFFLLTRMQDEVHRVAISYHKKLRSAYQTKSILDEIEGIGPKRKKMLMQHFQSFKQIKEASLQQLQEVLPAKVAEMLYNTIREL